MIVLIICCAVWLVGGLWFQHVMAMTPWGRVGLFLIWPLIFFAALGSFAIEALTDPES